MGSALIAIVILILLRMIIMIIIIMIVIVIITLALLMIIIMIIIVIMIVIITGVGTNGVTANVIELYVLLQRYFLGTPINLLFIFPEVPGRTFFPYLSKFITFAAAPLVMTPFVRNQGAQPSFSSCRPSLRRLFQEGSGSIRFGSGLSKNNRFGSIRKPIRFGSVRFGFENNRFRFGKLRFDAVRTAFLGSSNTCVYEYIYIYI